jgi:hypothetical protein
MSILWLTGSVGSLQYDLMRVCVRVSHPQREANDHEKIAVGAQGDQGWSIKHFHSSWLPGQ